MALACVGLPPELAHSGDVARVDAHTGAILADLEQEKRVACQQEDYMRARALRSFQDRLAAAGRVIARLTVRKQLSVAREDFGDAARVQRRIGELVAERDALAAQTPGPSCGRATTPFSAGLWREFAMPQPRADDPRDDRTVATSGRGAGAHPVDCDDGAMTSGFPVVPVLPSHTPLPSSLHTPPPSPPRALPPPPSSTLPLPQSESALGGHRRDGTDGGAALADEPLVPAGRTRLRRRRASGQRQRELEEVEARRLAQLGARQARLVHAAATRTPQVEPLRDALLAALRRAGTDPPEAMSEERTQQAAELIAALGEFAVQCILARDWRVRSAAALVIHDELLRLAHEPPAAFSAVCSALEHLLPDPVPQVAHAAMQLTCALLPPPGPDAVEGQLHTGVGWVPRSRCAQRMQPIVPLLVSRMADAPTKVRTAAVNALLHVARHSPGGVQRVAATAMTMGPPPHLASNLCERARLVTKLVQEFGFQPKTVLAVEVCVQHARTHRSHHHRCR